MKKIAFEQAALDATAYRYEDFPSPRLPEIACVGRSNVGKSSLINHLLKKKLAKTSSVPGKTQSINFFSVDDKITLVDLPGYGYARVPKETRAKWAEVIDRYFEGPRSLHLILFLIDSRRNLTEEDRALAKWAASQNKPIFIVLTKADKISESEKKKNLQLTLEHLKQIFPSTTVRFLYYSIKDPRARIELIKNINDFMNHGTHQ